MRGLTRIATLMLSDMPIPLRSHLKKKRTIESCQEWLAFETIVTPPSFEPTTSHTTLERHASVPANISSVYAKNWTSLAHPGEWQKFSLALIKFYSPRQHAHFKCTFVFINANGLFSILVRIKDAAFNSIIYSLKVAKLGEWLWNQLVRQQFQVATGERASVNVFNDF